MTEREIFLAALQQATPGERAAFLDKECGADANLRNHIEALLAEHEQLGSYLETPAVPGQRTLDASPAGEGPGTVIGPYKLLQQIGEGGMGVVWMAEQTQSVNRKVALKVIKPGMDSRQVIARFEAERQALAMMDHVNIARVFDGGTTENGRPYFVMELVHGVPITKYCDDNHLTPRERLELFVPVCQAIQHAHQKGIIHRDIKPSNVMVTLYDGKPVPKVIDFGVAKATEQKLVERTLFTQYGSMVGTLEYMSPEQAETSALGVDTRSDIYSLGVLLYELLTGSTPLTHKRIMEVAYAEILRLIKEEEPPKPSTRLSDSGEALASISANRHMEPAKLTKLVKGELDWIVMKTLEKDRNRRYETASALAVDVQRYLNDEPVQACPPSAWYRFRKFGRRNKVALTVAALVAVVLTVSAATSTWQLFRAIEAEGLTEELLEKETEARLAAVSAQAESELRRRAAVSAQAESELRRQAAVSAQAESELRRLEATRERDEKTKALARVSQEKARADQNLAKARQAVKDYLVTATRNRLLKDADFLPLRKELLESALPFYEEFVKQKSDDPELEAERGRAYGELAEVREEMGELDRARVDLEEKLAIFRNLATNLSAQPAADRDRLARYRRELAVSLRILGVIYHKSGQTARAEAACREGLAMLLALKAEYPRQAVYRQEAALAGINLGNLRRELGRTEEALADHCQAVELLEGLVAEFPENLPFRYVLSVGQGNLSVSFKTLGRHDKALAALERAESILKELSEASPLAVEYRESWTLTLNNKASLLRGLGRAKEGLVAQEQAVRIEEKLAADFPSVPAYRENEARSHLNRSALLLELARPDEALTACDKAQDILNRLMLRAPKSSEYRMGLFQAHNNRALALQQLLRPKEALTYFQKGRAVQEELVADLPAIVSHRHDLAMIYNNMGNVHSELGQHAEAIAILEKALPIWEKLVRDFPRVPAYAVYLSGAYLNMGNAVRERDQPKASLEWYAKALAALAPVLAQEPRLALARAVKSRSHTGRAAALDDLGRYAEALKDWDQGLAYDDGFQGNAIRQERAATLARLKGPAPATALVVGNVLKGALIKDDAFDSFPLTQQSHRKAHDVLLEAGQPYLIDLTGDFDTFLRVEDSKKQPVLFNDDVRPDELNSRLVFIPSRKDSYRLIVTSYKAGDVGSYSLSIRRAAKAGWPTLIEDRLQDTDKKNQGRFFKMQKLQLVGGSSYTIELESRAFDTFLVLLDEAGKEVLTQNDDIAPGNTQLSRIDFTPRADAVFTIVVTSFGEGETGAYQLTVQRYEAVKEAKK